MTAHIDDALRISGRYTVLSELGRGGMACVYRVLDVSTGQQFALKQLLAQPDDRRARETKLLFEREFRTLRQITHPRMIAVYDYGVDTAGPYYTMELLDGGDLRERSPMPWQRACELVHDVASSLALLHSRRFVHRDVSPRNVLCTSDGRAKLIDFGAMIPMGETAQAVGTPPFVAPEVVQGAAIDARADLFSLGNTLYFALTGRLAYPARDFSQLLESWSHKPSPPSAYVRDIPPAIDTLVMSLINLEAALRPRSAFEVMQRLATLAQIERDDSARIARAYLVTPALVGRSATLADFDEQLQRALHGRGRGLSIVAPSGLGRSRILDECALEAKMAGACVVRANAAGPAELATAHALALQLLEAAPLDAPEAAHAAGVFDQLFEPTTPATGAAPPQLRSFARSVEERPRLRRALVKWLVQYSRSRPLAIVVDDVTEADDASIALLATLAERARQQALLILVSLEPAQDHDAQSALGAEVLQSRCLTWTLPALSAAETETLLGSMFGDVPNLALLGARLHAIAAGNPRQTIELAQHLVDHGVISYLGGQWSLPEEFDPAVLPASAAAALAARVEQLRPIARRLIEAQALDAQSAYSAEDYALLTPEVDEPSLCAALDELTAKGLLTRDSRGYTLDNRALERVLCEGLDDERRRAGHTALAQMYEQSGRSSFAAARHWLLAGDHARGLDRLLQDTHDLEERITLVEKARISIADIADTLTLALKYALASGRRQRDIQQLRDWLTLLSASLDDESYWLCAEAWLKQLAHDSGLDDYRAAHHIADPQQRLVHALTTAATRYANTPEDERIYAPDVAIRRLVAFVAVSIAISARALDMRLLGSLPALLEPFASLSPLVHAIWQNAIASYESTALRQLERARTRWLESYESLGKETGQDPRLIDTIRYAIAYGVGLGEASFGMESALRWAELLDGDPMQRVNSMYLRKVLRLQQGDFEGAERCRKHAELLALQSSTRQMFSNLLAVELAVHAAAWDLTGVKQIAARIEPLAERYAGWVPYRHLARGHYLRLSGDLEAATQAYQQCIALTEPDTADPQRCIVAWPSAVSACVEIWVALGRAADAKRLGARALELARERELGASDNDIVRALALAEGKLGELDSASARLDALIERQRAMGVTGLNLGMTYEARARVAIWAGARADVERFGRLTAEQYRHGRGSLLGTRYERLMEEARGRGVSLLPTLSAFETTIFGKTEFGARASIMSSIVTAMQGAHDRSARAERALRLLCDARGTRAGYLYLAGDERLQLAASSSGGVPDDILQRLVSDFWSQLESDTEPDTEMMVSEDQTQHLQVWRDRQGTAYQPLLLNGRLNGNGVVAGLAVLASDMPANDGDMSQPLASELASFLLHAGDSRSA